MMPFAILQFAQEKGNDLVTKSTWNMSWINSTEVLDNISYLKRCHQVTVASTNVTTPKGSKNAFDKDFY